MTSTGNHDKVEEIKNRLDIVDVIGRDIALKNKGSGEYTGATSSSSKSGASLKVDQKIQSFKNFATGEGGDVLDWIGYYARYKDTRGADFPEVLKIAAALAGVELEEATEEERNAAKEKADIHNLFTESVEVYHKNLKPEHYDYIKEKWGITKETVDKFKIGYATTGRDLKDLDKEILKKSGLVYVNGGMSGGEVFTGRIIFPYWKNGKVVYLIGRETEETPEAEREKGMKYKKLLVHKEDREYVSHSVQNSYFYGEDSLRGSDYCIITEGVADCISMLQAGFPCISPVTVQFREKDNQKLISLANGLNRVYICNDNEANNAGLKGALSTAEALESAGIETRLIELPKPEGIDKIDIADYMKEHIPEDFNELIDSSLRLWDFKLNQQVIKESSTSLERLRAFKSFISNECHLMQQEEWQIFVNNEVVKKFNLNKKDVQTTIEEIRKGRPADNKEEVIQPEEAQDKNGTEDTLSKYPAWTIDKANDILKNGDPFKFVLDTWQKRHVGDINIGENCLCSVVTRNVLNCERGLHIKPSGESGKGKSDAIECMLELFPEGIYITGSMSAKALFYDKSLKPGTIIYSDDASFSEDVISTIKQSTSKFQKVTVHRTVVNGEFKPFEIPERITYWFSAVEGMDDEQLANRFLHAEVDNSAEQDERVHKHQKYTESWYESDIIEPDVLVCRCIFDVLFKEFYRVKIPFVDAITWNNTENRRNFDKFKDIIRAVTVYNCQKRENFEGFVLATVEDYERALKIYKGTSVNNATNLTDTEIKYLRYITASPEKTVTVKMLQNNFKVSDIAVRNMLNGKKGNGGFLAKVRQLVVWDQSTAVKSESVTTASREKRYQYTGDLSGLDLYESISEIDYDAVVGVTMKYKAELHENKTRVTEGNLEGNLPKVTLENKYSNHNNIINNTNITTNTEYKGGYENTTLPAAVHNAEYEKMHANFQVSPYTEKLGYPHEETSQLITETSITLEGYPRLPQVMDEGKTGTKTDAFDIHNQGYPQPVEGINSGIASLLRSALVKLAKSAEYNGIVEDTHAFVKVFNDRTPAYKDKLGNQAVLSNAERLHSRGWK